MNEEKPFSPELQHIGLGLFTHKMPCAICIDNKAVFTMPEGIFLPCWKCQERYELKKKNWFKRCLAKRGKK